MSYFACFCICLAYNFHIFAYFNRINSLAYICILYAYFMHIFAYFSIYFAYSMHIACIFHAFFCIFLQIFVYIAYLLHICCIFLFTYSCILEVHAIGLGRPAKNHTGSVHSLHLYINAEYVEIVGGVNMYRGYVLIFHIAKATREEQRHNVRSRKQISSIIN